jgi:quercetin dioxygenase-like cupin family protein
MIEKNVFDFKKEIDFNYVCDLVDLHNFESSISSDHLTNYVLKGVFKIKNIQLHDDFKSLYAYCEKEFNPEKKHSNMFMFFSMKSGGASITHKDPECVYIIGVKGKTWYKVGDKEGMVEKGDLLKIPAQVTHTAIGLTPRIVLSYGIF